MVDINDFPKEEFDVCILVAGNFELLTIIENGFVKSDKNVLYATDYWNENRFDHSVKTMFDVVYGRPSYLVDNNTFKKGFFNGGRLLVGSEFIDLKKAPPKIKKNLSYFGKLYGSRDYTSFLKILDSISKQIEKTNFQMIIYTDKVSLRKKYKNISFKNLVFGEKYYESLSDSDWLLVLDNTVEYQKWIPSKLYEAMLYKKPIVLFTDNPKSFSLVDIHLYDLFFIVDMNNFNDQTIAEFVEFLNKTDGKTSNIDLFSIFPECDKKNFYKQLMKDLYGEDLNQ